MAKTAVTPHVTIDLTPSGQASTALTAKQTALGIVITDKASHERCRETLKGWKALKRTIEDHFAAIKRPINDAKNAILEMERKELAPITEAISIAERTDVAYTTEQKRLEQARADAQRREDEAKAAAKREADLAALEASSDDLSDRERVFCDGIVDGLAPEESALRADFKMFTSAAKRLLAMPKIQQAIAALREAKELAAKPVIVESTSRPESQIASVSGTALKTYYGCGDIDIATLKAAWVAGTVPADTFTPNLVALNAAARSLKELFPQAYPGASLSKKQGIAG